MTVSKGQVRAGEGAGEQERRRVKGSREGLESKAGGEQKEGRQGKQEEQGMRGEQGKNFDELRTAGCEERRGVKWRLATTIL